MGSISRGIDEAARGRWLDDRHVEDRKPCAVVGRAICAAADATRSDRRGRPACDFIRGWLDYCLRAYLALSDERARWFLGSLTPGP